MNTILFVLVIGIICIGNPIFAILSLQELPWYMTVAYCVWLVACVGTIAHSKGEDKKWYERMYYAFAFTLVFEILYVSSMAKNDPLFDDIALGCFLTPPFNLPAFYFIAACIREHKVSSYKRRVKENNENIDRKINAAKTELEELERRWKDGTVNVHLFDLLERCGADMSQIKCNQKIASAYKIEADIKTKKETIHRLKMQKKSL